MAFFFPFHGPGAVRGPKQPCQGESRLEAQTARPVPPRQGFIHEAELFFSKRRADVDLIRRFRACLMKSSRGKESIQGDPYSLKVTRHVRNRCKVSPDQVSAQKILYEDVSL